MMRIRNSAQEIVLDQSSETKDDRITLETSNGVYQIIVGRDSGDLYITACTKSRLVVLPCGDYNCIQLSQQNV